MGEKSITQILFENGYIVTNKKFGGWDNGKRMVTDMNGKELGFHRPLDALKLVKNKKDLDEKRDDND